MRKEEGGGILKRGGLYGTNVANIKRDGVLDKVRFRLFFFVCLVDI